MRLYELTGKYAWLQEEAFDYASDHDGEIPPNLADAISQIEQDLNEKLDACCRMVANMTATADACENEAARLTKKSKRLKDRADSLKAYMKFCMEEAGLLKVKPSACFGLRICKSPPSVDIEAGVELPRGFIKVVESPDRALIKNALQSGVEIAGCRLVTDNTHLRID
jgi:hypothetical protein